MIRLLPIVIVIVVFVWFFSTMREKFQDYKARHGGPDYPSENGDPDGSSGPWGSTGRPKKAQQARPKAEVIEIEPLRAARDAQKNWATDEAASGEAPAEGTAAEGAPAAEDAPAEKAAEDQERDG